MATQTSCISHPANQRLVIIREDYLKICEGNHCAAALLNLFEHGHNRKLGNQKDALHANEVAEQHGERGTQDTSLLQWHNQQELEDGLLNLYKRMVIRKGLDVLLQKGYVSVHKNPTSRYHFDKTHYFRFHPEVVQSQLLDIFDEPKIAHRREKNSSSSAKNSSSSAKNSSSRSLITPELSVLEFSPLSSPAEKTSPLTPETLMDLYNTLVPSKHPKVIRLSDARIKRAREFLTQFPDQDFWTRTFSEIAQSQMLQGRAPSKGHEHFIANFDWFFQKGRDGIENCVKAYEGKYRDSPLDGLSLAGKISVLASQRIVEQEQDYGAAGTPPFLAIARRHG